MEMRRCGRSVHAGLTPWPSLPTTSAIFPGAVGAPAPPPGVSVPATASKSRRGTCCASIPAAVARAISASASASAAASRPTTFAPAAIASSTSRQPSRITSERRSRALRRCRSRTTLSTSRMSHARYDVPVALSIAGSDSGGGAGIQADLRTFQEFGVYGTSVVTAVTAQSSTRVLAWESVSAELVLQQLEAAIEDHAPGAVKTGMLATSDVVEAVARGIARHRLPNYVMDPVIVSTSGTRLLKRDAE